MIIGLANNSYPEQRCITCIDNNTFVNLKKKNLFLYFNYIESKLFKMQPNFIFKSIYSLEKYRIDILHFFNYIPITKLKWVVSFETAIPRIRENITLHHVRDGAALPARNEKTAKILKYIVQDNCIALIPLSQCAFDIQVALLSRYPEVEKEIISKMKVVHPPQQLHVTEKIQYNDKVNFIFVGKDFYRKGGAEIILAFSELFQENMINADQVTVTMIGDTNSKHNYLHGKFPDDKEFYNALNAKISLMPFLNLHQSLPNKEVITAMLQSDIGLLPTWGDTYGYSVLEMQSCGCPVVTTNVRALPEINNEKAGWLIDLKLNRFGEVIIDSAEDKRLVREQIVHSLKKIVIEAVNNREIIAGKAQEAICRIREEHDPVDYKRIIEGIYEQ